jgi:hypothetical protein
VQNIAAPAADQPLLLTLLIALGGSVIGGGFTLLGGWLNARLNREKDKVERDARWNREDEQRRYADHRELMIDVAEVVEAQKSWLNLVDYGFEHDDKAPLSAHKFQLSGRIRLFGSPALNFAWQEFMERIHYVEGEMLVGNIHLDPATNRTDLDDQNACPDARLHGDVVLALAGILLVEPGSVSHFDLLMMEVEQMREAINDARYVAMRDKWLEQAQLKNSFWETLKEPSRPLTQT